MVKLKAFTPILSVIAAVSFINAAIAQNSFELLIQRDSSSTCNVLNLIEASDGNYVGSYNYWDHPGHYAPQREHIISITTDGDTATFPFYRESDSIIHFDKIIQVNHDPIRYFVVGTIDDSLHNALRPKEVFMLLDSNFELIWEKQHSLSAIDWNVSYSDIMQLADGSFLYARRPTWFEQYMYIAHLSPTAEILTFREYEGDSAGSPIALTYSPDSNCYWMHTLGAHFTGTNSYSTVIELDSQLEQQRVMHYPRWLDYNFYAKVLPNNRLIATGRYQDGQSNQLVSYLVDTGLNVLSESFLTSSDTALGTYGQTVDYVYPNHIYVGGTHNLSLWGDSSYVVLAKYNSDLELIFEKYIGDSVNYYLFDLTATTDSGVLLQCRRYDYWDPIIKRKALVLKLTDKGILVSNGEIKSDIKIKDAIVYPNPGGNILNLRTALKNTTFSLYNQQGHIVAQQKIKFNINKISTSWLPPGLYIWTLEKDSKLIETGKWIKQ